MFQVNGCILPFSENSQNIRGRGRVPQKEGFAELLQLRGMRIIRAKYVFYKFGRGHEGTA